MKVYIGADHNGFKLKEYIKSFLTTRGYKVVDVGNTALDPKDDYPVFAFKLGELVTRNGAKGILTCGTAQGMCIAANKVKGIRAAIVDSVEETKLVRKHNNANVICVRGWNKPKHIEKIILAFLKTKFSKAKRHRRRVKEIENYERKN